ncbi:hypothetical protein GCM10009794_16200 [Rothia terrae]
MQPYLSLSDCHHHFQQLLLMQDFAYNTPGANMDLMIALLGVATLTASAYASAKWSYSDKEHT